MFISMLLLVFFLMAKADQINITDYEQIAIRRSDEFYWSFVEVFIGSPPQSLKLPLSTRTMTTVMSSASSKTSPTTQYYQLESQTFAPQLCDLQNTTLNYYCQKICHISQIQHQCIYETKYKSTQNQAITRSIQGYLGKDIFTFSLQKLEFTSSFALNVDYFNKIQGQEFEYLSINIIYEDNAFNNWFYQHNSSHQFSLCISKTRQGYIQLGNIPTQSSPNFQTKLDVSTGKYAIKTFTSIFIQEQQLLNQFYKKKHSVEIEQKSFAATMPLVEVKKIENVLSTECKKIEGCSKRKQKFQLKGSIPQFSYSCYIFSFKGDIQKFDEFVNQKFPSILFSTSEGSLELFASQYGYIGQNTIEQKYFCLNVFGSKFEQYSISIYAFKNKKILIKKVDEKFYLSVYGKNDCKIAQINKVNEQLQVINAWNNILVYTSFAVFFVLLVVKNKLYLLCCYFKNKITGAQGQSANVLNSQLE